MEIVGRDKYTQHGDNAKIAVDNRSDKKKGFWKGVWITVVASIIFTILVAIWNLLFD